MMKSKWADYTDRRKLKKHLLLYIGTYKYLYNHLCFWNTHVVPEHVLPVISSIRNSSLIHYTYSKVAFNFLYGILIHVHGLPNIPISNVWVETDLPTISIHNIMRVRSLDTSLSHSQLKVTSLTYIN